MKAVVLHFSLIAALFWCACSVQTPPPRPMSAEFAVVQPNDWRRTTHGWERRSEWAAGAPVPARRWQFNLTAVHPLNVAALQAFISVGALLLLSPPHAGRHSTTSPDGLAHARHGPPSA